MKGVLSMNYQLEVEEKNAYLAASEYMDWNHPLIQKKEEEALIIVNDALEDAVKELADKIFFIHYFYQTP